MKTSSGLSLGLFTAPLLCLLWLTQRASARLSAPEVVTGAYGGSVAVPCLYDSKFRDNTKYWCKGPIYDLCQIVAKTPRRRPEDRGSIVDDKEAGVFTVTMSSLTVADGGMYWCVISGSGRNIHTGVKLLVAHTGDDDNANNSSAAGCKLVDDAALDHLYSNVVLLGINTHCCVEDNGREKKTAATTTSTISTSRVKHLYVKVVSDLLGVLCSVYKHISSVDILSVGELI